jgi:TonB family protein
MSHVWAKLEGHAVNGVFPLIRHLGGSTHSVVFLTESAKLARSELALKLVPAVPALAQLQLARWQASAALIHPHLIQIHDTGHCQIGGRHFLYVVTDYADQNLAQLLERRALTDDETREMMMPVLDALAVLHEKKLVQGRLKPSNLLVVGDQLKLASDTIRPVSETGRVSNVTSAYLPPEASAGTRTAASDVWGLGITLCEALTRQLPSGLHAGETVLPPELSPAFRGVVSRCLSPRPKDRPTVKELQVWTRGAQWIASQAASQAAISVAESDEDDSARTQSPQQRPVARGSARRFSMGVAVILGALTLFGIGWAAIRSSGNRPAPATPDAVIERAGAPAAAVVPTASRVSQSQAERSSISLPVAERPVRSGNPVVGKPVAGKPAAPPLPAEAEEEALPSAVSEVIPDVPQRARQGIRGRVRVSVRLIVDKQGKVFAALVDDPGPSRYFEQLALEAAGKWMFPPAAARSQRLMLVRFDFTREGATAHATAVE